MGDFSAQTPCLQLERKPGWALLNTPACSMNTFLSSLHVILEMCLFSKFYYQVIKLFEAMNLEKTMTQDLDLDIKVLPRQNTDESIDLVHQMQDKL